MSATQTLALTDRLDESDVQAIDHLRDVNARLRKELGRVIVGQQDTIERLAICLFARGHGLLMGVPGLAKTLLGQQARRNDVAEIQPHPVHARPDADGHHRHRHSSGQAGGRREFEFVHGPVFANIVLADEINRAPPKTQAAMLEAMQEQKVTVVGKTFRLEPPFFVLATQNPVEQEGTYPLPEAQLDRFMFLIELDYPSEEEEVLIARTTTGEELPELGHLLHAEDIIRHQHLVRRVPVPDHIYAYAAGWCERRGRRDPTSPAWLKPLVAWGAGPRAVQYLILGAKARGRPAGQLHGPPGRYRSVAEPVLTHRVITTFAAQAEGIDAKQIVRRLVEETEGNGLAS